MWPLYPQTNRADRQVRIERLRHLRIEVRRLHRVEDRLIIGLDLIFDLLPDRTLFAAGKKHAGAALAPWLVRRHEAVDDLGDEVAAKNERLVSVEIACVLDADDGVGRARRGE